MHIKPTGAACAMLAFVLNVAGAADTVPQSLAPPAELNRLVDLNADGVQIYRCGPPKESAGAPAAVWNFESPRATLTDAQGKPAGRHYAGPTWEATDGSKITGKIAARAPAPDPQAIAWLLLKTESAGTAGRFDNVRAVQRVFTQGGSAPAGACTTVGEVLEVPYRAVYVFWAQ
jgi:hypothetical protein